MGDSYRRLRIGVGVHAAFWYLSHVLVCAGYPIYVVLWLVWQVFIAPLLVIVMNLIGLLTAWLKYAKRKLWAKR